MSEFTEMWRVKHNEPLNYNERIVNNACDIIEELEADIKIKQGVCETIEKEVTAINEKLKERINALESKPASVTCPHCKWVIKTV